MESVHEFSSLVGTSFVQKESVPVRDFSPEERELWYRTIETIYQNMRAKASDGPYEICCEGIVLTVSPNVYAPRFFTDSLWFAEELPRIVGTRSLLEIGTGTGILAIACARNGSRRVVATDVNPDAVRNAQLNVTKLKPKVEIRQGSLYGPIRSDETFDCIFWAHPFNNWPVPVADMLLRSGMDYHYEGVRGYIAGAGNHLTNNGRLLLGTGDSADLETISRFATENGYELDLLSESEMPLEEGSRLLINYLIYELVPA